LYISSSWRNLIKKALYKLYTPRYVPRITIYIYKVHKLQIAVTRRCVKVIITFLNYKGFLQNLFHGEYKEKNYRKYAILLGENGTYIYFWRIIVGYRGSSLLRVTKKENVGAISQYTYRESTYICRQHWNTFNQNSALWNWS
jgi:hypothetical protein